MRILQTQPLFAWECLDDSPNLKTIKEFLATIPDAKLLASLRAWRGRGRDDYPVHALWGTLVLTVALRHPSMEACLAELRRNEGLRRVIGIESESQVPKAWNMSRFLEVLGREPHRSLEKEVFNEMACRLGEGVPDLGRQTAGDSAALSARCAPGEKRGLMQDGLPVPSGGRKEYTDDLGVVTHVVEWFGYKLHQLVDVRHEVALSYEISSTKAGDNELLPALVTQAQANLPAGRIRTLAYDKAADTEDVHAYLSGQKIAPIIQNRSLWRDDSERMLPGHDGNSNVVYDESGTVYCYDKISEPAVRHRMSYIGHEPRRQTIKYRCPARHEGWRCPSEKRCNAGKNYGKTVRVKRDVDVRRFPPIPRATKQFERLYKGRTAVERVNARIKVFWGADDGNIVGALRFHAFLGTVMVVHLGFATLLASTPRVAGTLGRMRLGPIAEALRKRWAG
jgi:hypothetical protein